MKIWIGKRWKEAALLALAVTMIGYMFGFGFRLASFVCPQKATDVNLTVSYSDEETASAE